MSLCEGYHFLHRVFDQAQVVSKLVCRHCVLDRELSVRTMLDFLRLDAIAYPGHADGGFFVFFSGWVHEPSVETGSRSRRRDRRGRTKRPGHDVVPSGLSHDTHAIGLTQRITVPCWKRQSESHTLKQQYTKAMENRESATAIKSAHKKGS